MLNDSLQKKLFWFFTILILIFILFQLKKVYFREKVVFENYPEKEIVIQDSKFNLKGRVFNISNLYLNNKEYFLDENNKFNINLNLFKGCNKFILKVKTNSGSEIEKDILIYRK